MAFSKERLLSAAGWSSAGLLLQTLIGALSTVLLVRLLGPEPFGILALALLVTELAEIIVGRHAADFLTREKALKAGHESAALVLLFGTGAGLSLVTALAAPFAAEAFSVPSLAPLLLAMAVFPVLTALTSFAEQLHIRALRFAVLAKIGTASSLIGAVVGCVLALWGAGIWSLFGMELARRLAALAANHAAARWSWRSGFTGRELLDVARFGSRRVENKVLQYISINAVPRALIGAFLGTQALGYYTVARRILKQLNEVLSGPIASVGFPVVSRMEARSPELKKLMAGTIKGTTWIVWPAMIGLAITAPVLIPLLYGQEWEPAVPVIQLLSLGFLRSPLTGIISAVLTGTGQLRALSSLQIVSILVIVGLSALLLPLGLTGIAAALALRQWLLWPIGAYFVWRATGYGAAEQMRILGRAGVPALVMGAGVLALDAGLLHRLPDLLRFGLQCSGGVVLYALVWSVWTGTSPRRVTANLKALLARRSVSAP